MWLLNEMMEAKNRGKMSLNSWKTIISSLLILKEPFKNEGKVKTFSGKQRLREFCLQIFTKSNAKGVLQVEGNDPWKKIEKYKKEGRATEGVTMRVMLNEYRLYETILKCLVGPNTCKF